MPGKPITASFNHSRFRTDDEGGFYESFFQRANHPSRPLAFWIRYTSFCPIGRPNDAIGELWAIYFDGEAKRHVAAKTEVSCRECHFDREAFGARIGSAEIGPGFLRGTASSGAASLVWDLAFKGDSPPLFLFPLRMYEAPLPKAKSLVGLPLAAYDGVLQVNGETIAIRNWLGSQNHNWGSRHTDWYAWGQVAGFDDHPETFLEVATARIKLGPVWTPYLTPLVLRHGGREVRINRTTQTLRARVSFRYFSWSFACTAGALSLNGRIEAHRDDFVGLRYYNPPGGTKHCLNSKIASCELHVTDSSKGRVETLSTSHRAAFEILTDETEHGIEIRV